MEPILIDGSFGEGGGQIVRTSIALSAISGLPVRVINIRAKRQNPGLQHQHIAAIQAVALLSGAIVEGARLGNAEITFIPGKLRSGSFKFDVGTAGSVTLIAQAVLPILPFLPGPTSLEIRGGTDVKWSPTSDYFASIVKEIAERIGIAFSFEILKRGYYPKGGGLVKIYIDEPPGSIKPFRLVKRGGLKKIEVKSVAHNLPRHVAERQASSASRLVAESFRGVNIIQSIEDDSAGKRSLDPGSSVTLIAYTESSILGADSLGERGKRAETVGEEAAMKLVQDLSTEMALDRHMSDMAIPLAALAGRGSEIGGAVLTEHALTNAKVAELILDVKLKINGRPQNPFVLRVL